MSTQESSEFCSPAVTLVLPVQVHPRGNSTAQDVFLGAFNYLTALDQFQIVDSDDYRNLIVINIREGNVLQMFKFFPQLVGLYKVNGVHTQIGNCYVFVYKDCCVIRQMSFNFQ